jgi:hypothetical protein
VNLSLGSAGTAEFKYDRYPNGGPERIQCDDGEFARKNGKAWLKSNDWGETGKPADATSSKRLNNWVGLIDGRLNAEPALKFRTESLRRRKLRQLYQSRVTSSPAAARCFLILIENQRWASCVS